MADEAQAPRLPPLQSIHPTAPPKRHYETQEESLSPAEDGTKKRNKTTATSSRGVANLTPERLAKKRANDREAQRAIRERTKNHIEDLVTRIKELTSQQPYQELQHALREKEQAEADNADIKKRLAQVLELIQPILGHKGPAELPAYSPPQDTYMVNRPSSSNFNASTPSSIASPGGSQWNTPVSQSSEGDSQHLPMRSHVQQLVKQRHDMSHNLDIGPERLGLEFLLDGSQHLPKTNSTHVQGLPYQPRVSDRSNSVGHRSGLIQSTILNNSSDLPYYAIPVRNGPPTCPLDNVLLDFLHEQQSLVARGPSVQNLGPAYPSVASLLNPSLVPQTHPLSKVFVDIIATFPDISTLPEKVAILYIMFIYMRWQILPSSENYDRLPSWMQPRVSQVTTPHPAWVDFIPWPAMRDRIVRDYNPREYLFDNFFIPWTTTLSVGWEYEDVDCLLHNSGGGGGGGGGGRSGEGDVCINPVFERHLRRLENWSLGPAFDRAFPSLEGTYRLVRPKGKSNS